MHIQELWLRHDSLAKASFALQTFTKIYTKVMWNGYYPHSHPPPSPPLSFTTFCSFATLKNWNTQKQFRELDSVTFKLPRHLLLLFLLRLIYFPGRVLLAFRVDNTFLSQSPSLKANCNEHFSLYFDYLPAIFLSLGRLNRIKDGLLNVLLLIATLLSLHHNDDPNSQLSISHH
jgi:hypothetical protein